jgi:cell division ATPase FtsA
LNKKINELEMTIFISMGEERVLKEIENTIGKYFNFNQIRFSSFNLSFFTVVRDMHTMQEDFLLLDIDGEVTNISMVKKNVLRESMTFPLGRNFLLREIASSLKCTLNEASSLFSLFINKHTEKSITQKMTLIMDQIKIKWLKSFQESLSNLSSDISIPSTLYIVTEKSSAEFFSQIIKDEQFNQYALTESKFKIIFLDIQTFHNIAVFNDSSIKEPSLIIDSIYINRFLINPAKTGRA